MSELLSSLNWTALIMTALICYTINRTIDRLRPLAKLWLDGLKTEKEIEAMRRGCQPRGNQR